MQYLGKANLWKQQISGFLKHEEGAGLTITREEATFRMTEIWSDQSLGFALNVPWDVGLLVLKTGKPEKTGKVNRVVKCSKTKWW